MDIRINLVVLAICTLTGLGSEANSKEKYYYDGKTKSIRPILQSSTRDDRPMPRCPTPKENQGSDTSFQILDLAEFAVHVICPSIPREIPVTDMTGFEGGCVDPVTLDLTCEGTTNGNRISASISFFGALNRVDRTHKFKKTISNHVHVTLNGQEISSPFGSSITAPTYNFKNLVLDATYEQILERLYMVETKLE